ncbi:MAG: hypothetical protein AAGD11_07640 [Planctomycetota bacterium]
MNPPDQHLQEQYDQLIQQMNVRIAELEDRYDNDDPVNRLLAILQDDPQLEAIDQQLCRLEQLLPDCQPGESESTVRQSMGSQSMGSK